ncbi:hypothetical protein B0H17DRAFT_1135080 [Mycena rosella]|uniref:Uncharacterized protein n=1 Tax=Mycena rosella TaxID=1033263 RepID=A0AAD7GFZ4_MYCRO|nr:hypothetical protein B0H17DRAFT_1135080 [Mycena rosella]
MPQISLLRQVDPFHLIVMLLLTCQSSSLSYIRSSLNPSNGSIPLRPSDARRNSPRNCHLSSQDNTSTTTATEAEELLRLAHVHAAHRSRPNIARDWPVTINAREYTAGLTLSATEQRTLLARLRYRSRDARRASAIADFLHWTPARSVEEWVRPSGLEEMKEAEAAEAQIATEFFLGPGVGVPNWNGKGRPWKTTDPGAWLADA